MKKFLISILSIFIFINFADAENYFQTLVNSAFQHNYFIKSYEKIVENSKNNIKLAESYFLPTLDFNYTYSQSNEPGTAAFLKAKQGKFSMSYYYNHMTDPPYVKNNQYVLSLIQPIFSKGNVYLSKKQAKLKYLAEIDSLNQVKREIKFKIFQTLINAYKIIDFIDIAKAMKSKASVYYSIEKELYKNGTALKSDLLFAKYNLEKADIELNSIKNNLNKVKNILKQLTGKYFEIKKVNFEYSNRLNVDELINYAIKNRDDLKAFRKYLKIADIEIKKSKNEYLPSVYGFANYERNSDKIFHEEKHGITAGIGVKFNIFNGLRDSINIDKAKVAYFKLKALFLNKQEAVKREIRNALIDFKNAEFSFNSMKELVKSNKTALSLSENRFKQGLERITTLVDMQTNYKTSLKELSKSKWELILKYYLCLFYSGKF